MLKRLYAAYLATRQTRAGAEAMHYLAERDYTALGVSRELYLAKLNRAIRAELAAEARATLSEPAPRAAYAEAI